MKVLVLFTCFNRKNKTENCIKNLIKMNKNISFSFIIVDDNSNDGTIEMLLELKGRYDIKFIQGDGNLYYSGGMRMGMNYIIDSNDFMYDYLLMVNDDVEFFEETIEKMIIRSKNKDNSIIVGATQNSDGLLSYGAIKYYGKIRKRYRKIDINESDLNCDTFNANCVLIPYYVFLEVGSMDSHYIHSLGDFDYGLELKNNGYSIFSTDEYVGLCNNNSIRNTWNDIDLPIKDRIRLKEDPKGAPIKPWFYYLNKNFNIITAIIGSITPYVRILLKK